MKGIISPIRDTLGLHWGYIGMMENKMETTIVGYLGFRVIG